MTEDRPEWVEEAARLTRIAASGDDEARQRRDEIANDNGYEARLREDGTLVLHPVDWLDENGVIDLKAFDADDAYEVPLDGGGFEEAREKNDRLLERFEKEASEVDAFNARAFVEFCENHHATAVKNANEDLLCEFLEEYYVRNVWAPEKAKERVEESLCDFLTEAGREDLSEYLYATK